MKDALGQKQNAAHTKRGEATKEFKATNLKWEIKISFLG